MFNLVVNGFGFASQASTPAGAKLNQINSNIRDSMSAIFNAPTLTQPEAAGSAPVMCLHQANRVTAILFPDLACM